MTDKAAQRGLHIGLMHEVFGDLFFQLDPAAPREMRVFAADLGDESTPNIELQAAIFDEDWEIVGEPVTRMVAKACLPELWGLKE